jgi:hypothetical protein
LLCHLAVAYIKEVFAFSYQNSGQANLSLAVSLSPHQHQYQFMSQAPKLQPPNSTTMAAPGRKFSFNRLITNMIPNMANDSKNDVDLSPAQADQLLTYQCASKYPRHLSRKAFFIAGITSSDSFSQKVHKALVKHKIILPVPEASSSPG